MVGLVRLSPLRLSLLNGGIWVKFSFQGCLFDLSSSAQVHEMATFQTHNHNLEIFFKLNLIILYITNQIPNFKFVSTQETLWFSSRKIEDRI